jgi:subtilisin family serine protease
MDPLLLEAAGEGITVAVLDTGLWKHNDLPEPAFVANFTRSRTVYDRQGHGTHVAGTIGARADGKGVIGWAPKCNIGCVKVLGDDGSGASAGIAKGIYYSADQGADIINLSLGGGYDPLIEQACNDVIQQGVFVICAAGNEGAIRGRNTIGWPARLPNTLAIGSHRKDGKVSEFSSRGKQVDMSFPGEDILSTWIDNTFRSISGTSMATPAACGLTAVMLSHFAKAKKEGKVVKPIRNNTELREHWAEHAIEAGVDGKDIHYGWGYPDINGIVRANISDKEEEAEEPDTVTDGWSLLGKFGVKLIEHEGNDGVFLYIKE